MMRVMGENLLVETIDMEKQTESGIAIVQQHDRHDHNMLAAKVVDIGPMAFSWEKKEKPYSSTLPEKDDYIIIKRYSGVKVELPEVEYKIVSDSDVLAITDKETVEEMRKWTQK